MIVFPDIDVIEFHSTKGKSIFQNKPLNTDFIVSIELIEKDLSDTLKRKEMIYGIRFNILEWNENPVEWYSPSVEHRDIQFKWISGYDPKVVDKTRIVKDVVAVKPFELTLGESNG